MASNNDRWPVTFEEAVAMLPDGPRIHTVRGSASGVMLGADWGRDKLIGVISKHGAELSGPIATRSGHGLCCVLDGSWLFIETAREYAEMRGEAVAQ